jgi:hypothetical protein
MRKLFFILPLATILLLSACNKVTCFEPQQPMMIYKDLQNAEIKYGQPKTLDIDDDGSIDFSFGVVLVGDPILQTDRMQFYARSKVDRNLLNDGIDQTPVLNKLDVITKNHPGYSWLPLSSVVLAEKIINNNGSYWAGGWKNANHKYLPTQFKTNGKLYHGWIELSFDTAADKLILHKAGLSMEEDKDVKAGI